MTLWGSIFIVSQWLPEQIFSVNKLYNIFPSGILCKLCLDSESQAMALIGFSSLWVKKKICNQNLVYSIKMSKKIPTHSPIVVSLVLRGIKIPYLPVSLIVSEEELAENREIGMWRSKEDLSSCKKSHIVASWKEDEADWFVISPMLSHLNICLGILNLLLSVIVLNFLYIAVVV